MAIEVKGYVMKTMNEINEAAKLRGKQEEDKKFLENIKALWRIWYSIVFIYFAYFSIILSDSLAYFKL